MEELESSAASPKEAFRAPLLKEVNNIGNANGFYRTMTTHCSIFKLFFVFGSGLYQFKDS
jgi:hypothetical protein